MVTQKPLMFGNNILAHHLENRAVFEEEDDSHELEFQNHMKEILDPEVLDRIITTSIIEIIN